MEDLANVLAGCRRALDSYGFTTASEGVQRAETELAACGLRWTGQHRLDGLQNSPDRAACAAGRLSQHCCMRAYDQPPACRAECNGG